MNEKDLFDLKTITAIWGALLSTILVIVKFLELWRDRCRVDVGYNFTGSADIGNEIFIRNLSSKPIMLSFWCLYYGPKILPRRKLEIIECGDLECTGNRIDPQSSYVLRFAEENHFNWDRKFLEKKSIYIELHVAGRKPKLIKIYPK